SARAVEERSKAARELRTRMLATVDDLFAALGAVATAEQQPARARERAQARRSAIRAPMPPAGVGGGVASTDVDASLSRAGIDPAVVTAASRAAAPLDERLESALVRAADARDASDRAAARRRTSTPPSCAGPRRSRPPPWRRRSPRRSSRRGCAGPAAG
ncbi:MAG: hypothetical protein ACKOTD_00685, partial [Phycisphaerales bacterium]